MYMYFTCVNWRNTTILHTWLVIECGGGGGGGGGSRNFLFPLFPVLIIKYSHSLKVVSKNLRQCQAA